MNGLLKAVMDKIRDSDLYDSVGGRVYLDSAPEGSDLPYIVFFIVSVVPNNTFAEHLEDVAIQFSIFSNSLSAVEITTIYNNMKALFDDCEMTIDREMGTEPYIMWVKFQNLTTMVEEVTSSSGLALMKHWAVDYSIFMRTL